MLDLWPKTTPSLEQTQNFTWGPHFLSTPVRMHGGLICIAFRLPSCLSVTGPKLLDQNSDMMAIANCNSGVNHVTGRCALFNVKLHFFISQINRNRESLKLNKIYKNYFRPLLPSVS